MPRPNNPDSVIVRPCGQVYASIEQHRTLWEAFQEDDSPDDDRVEELAEETGLSERWIKRWFERVTMRGPPRLLGVKAPPPKPKSESSTKRQRVAVKREDIVKMEEKEECEGEDGPRKKKTRAYTRSKETSAPRLDDETPTTGKGDGLEKDTLAQLFLSGQISAHAYETLVAQQKKNNVEGNTNRRASSVASCDSTLALSQDARAPSAAAPGGYLTLDSDDATLDLLPPQFQSGSYCHDSFNDTNAKLITDSRAWFNNCTWTIPTMSLDPSRAPLKHLKQILKPYLTAPYPEAEHVDWMDMVGRVARGIDIDGDPVEAAMGLVFVRGIGIDF